MEEPAASAPSAGASVGWAVCVGVGAACVGAVSAAEGAVSSLEARVETLEEGAGG